MHGGSIRSLLRAGENVWSVGDDNCLNLWSPDVRSSLSICHKNFTLTWPSFRLFAQESMRGQKAAICTKRVFKRGRKLKTC